MPGTAAVLQAVAKDRNGIGYGGAAYGAVVLEAFEPGPGNDTIDGRSGWDEVYYNTGGWVGLRDLFRRNPQRFGVIVFVRAPAGIVAI